jgi:elongation factor P
MDTSDIRKGLKIMMDGQPYVVVDFQFVKPGKGQAFTRTKMKNMLTGGTIERNIRSSERLEPADVEDRTLQYIYPEGDSYVFMNSLTGDQVTVHRDAVGDDAGFLIDGIPVTITIYNGNPVSISLTFTALAASRCARSRSVASRAVCMAIKPARTRTLAATALTPAE